MSHWTFRPGTPTDLPAVAGVLAALWPDQVFTVQGLQHGEDEQNSSPLPLKRGRMLAEQGGRLLGFAEYEQYAGMYHPQKFSVSVSVHPDFQRRGLGRELAARLWNELSPHDPLSVLAGTQDDQPRGLEFLARQGFTEVIRYFESRLNVPAFDFTSFAAQEALPVGYLLTSYAALGETQATQRRLYDLWAELRSDVPRPEPETPVPFEQFVHRFQDAQYSLPGGYLLAVHGASGELVGVSELWKSDGEHLNVGLTGVQRKHRRHGLAMGLKLAAVRYAQSIGAAEMRTGNASNNVGMLRINAALGFVQQPAWVEMRRELR